LTFSHALTVTTDLTVNGNTTIGNAVGDTLTINAAINQDLVYSDAAFLIKANTVDGSDSSYIAFCGGGDLTVARGGCVAALGNEFANPLVRGAVQLIAGDVATGGAIEFYTGNTVERMRINYDGSIDIGTNQIGYDGSAGGLSFSAAHLATFSHAVTAGGNVTISKTLPDFTLTSTDTTITAAQVIGDIYFGTLDASANAAGNVGLIKVTAKADFADNDCQTYMSFHTNTGAAGSLAEVLRLDATLLATFAGNATTASDSNGFLVGAGSDMKMYYDGTAGNIDTDLVAASDLTIDCGTAKTVVLEVPVYKDANVGSLVLQTGGTLPGIVQIVDSATANTGIYTRGFDIGDQGSGSIEVPHDYKEGTNLTFHVHWGANDAPSGTDYVNWELTYSISRDGAVFQAATVIEKETAYDTQYEWVRSDFDAIDGSTKGPGGTGVKIGDQFNFTLKRIAAAGDVFSGEALVATLGFHYQCDTLGSRSIATK